MRVLLCTLSDPGYLYPAIAVGRELRGRGGEVSVLCRPGSVPAVHEAGLATLPAEDYGGKHAFSVGWWSANGHSQYAAVLRAAREVRADVLLTSVLCHGALLAAERLDLPIVVLGLAAHLWPYRSGGDGEPESVVGRHWRLRETLRFYQQARDQVGLGLRRDRLPHLPLIGSGLLLRGAPPLEYPGATLPEGVHHVGPCPWEPRADPGVIERLAARTARVGKPVVYVHLGRSFGAESMWPRLNAIFTGGPFQAIVERARSGPPLPDDGADLVVVRQPWMGPLIDMSEVVLSSGTSAPVLAAASRGKPMVVAPAGSEQPLLAEACRRAGIAVRLHTGTGGAAGADGADALTWACGDEAMRWRVQSLAAQLNGTASAAAAAAFVMSAAGDRCPVPAVPVGVHGGSDE
ncbi:hypothetical protein GCM10009557_24670 [Virgisporangium ochraceum]|uniref:Uncharacterized protein n=1 Tax=Virgisporangium ochraceum TaxID=65505 RepID=A0A8J3ZQA1_9ACTN|nr:hypothetical protein [Virgisporangium ochraceum]GIJ68449.1 hypothetical protein Voc01_033660 [Virgisporangium ochraceum]